MRLLRCGDSAVLVELADLDAVLALHAALVASPPQGVAEMVPAARTLLLRLEEGAGTDAVMEQVRGLDPRPGARPHAPRVEIPVVYDGADLAEVAEHTGLTPRGVVAAHTEQEWTVAFCGFAPGFGYLVGQDARLQVPRRDVPRTGVPAGSVGLAGEFTGVYPRESPGGWQLIGRTGARVWDLRRDPPALLTPGARVRFVEVA